MSSHAVQDHKDLDPLCHVVVLFPGGDRISGCYDGYGRVGIVDLQEMDEWYPQPFKMVIKKYYNDEKYEDLGPSKDEPNQGFFWDEKDLISLMKKYEEKLS